MIDVGGDDHLAGSNFVAHSLGRHFLPFGHIHHLFGDQALAGKVHLRKILVAGAGGLGAPPGNPFFADFGAETIAAAIVLAITRSHVCSSSEKSIITPTSRALRRRLPQTKSL